MNDEYDSGVENLCDALSGFQNAAVISPSPVGELPDG